MPLAILAFFSSFTLASVGMGIYHRLRAPAWLVCAVTALLLPAYWATMYAMPFHGILTEVPLVLMLGLAISGPIYLFLKQGIDAKRDGNAGHTAVLRPEGAPPARLKISPLLAVALGVFLPVIAFSLFSIVSRVNYACWLGWKCDGFVVEVTRDKPNHAAPMIIVNTNGTTERFVQVDDAFWARAKPGQRIRKDAGSPMAWLDGQLVRMVPRQVEWRNEPP
jgi:hypothetical protein